jgi:Exopolysaccharide synthesis, ExoD
MWPLLQLRDDERVRRREARGNRQKSLMTRSARPNPVPFVPASAILKEVQDGLQTDKITVASLIGSLHNSFGLLLLLLAVIAAVPGISVPAGLLLMIAAGQMIAGYPAPIFPR